MRILSGLFLALASLILSTNAPAQTGSDPDWLYRGSDIPRDPAWTFGTLPNGVRYAVRRNALPEGQVSIRVRIGTGALNEEDQERGWAHLVEHLAFRGSATFGDREARHVWQEMGANFGSDTNASTDATQTIYQLDLPHASREALDRSLHILSEMVDSALFAPEAVDAERKIVMAEKGRRPELSVRIDEIARPLFYAGLRYEHRDTIGTDATLAGATPVGLRAFYERWYRPDNATVILVGDADPKMMEELIRARFGDWKASGPAPAAPDYGQVASPKENVVALAYPGAPYHATLMWVEPWQRRQHSKARERQDLAQSFASRILNRRLEARARGDGAYVSAGAGATRAVNIANATQLSVTARGDKWREALADSYAVLSDALKSPPSQAEIDREFTNLRIAATSAVEGEATMRSQQRAQQVVNAVDGGSVVASAATTLALLDEFKPAMTPELIQTEMRGLFDGSGPRLMLLSPTPVDGGAEAVEAALAAAQQAAPATRLADRTIGFDRLPKLGPPGREVSRQRIEDLDVTIVRFANGSSLTFKRTDFEKGSVRVQLRFGSGLSGFDPGRPSLAWTSGVVAPSGLADLDQDGLERLLTGRRMSLGFGMGEDVFTLSGSTNGTDLADQLRLLAVKLRHPRWDPALFNRFKTATLDSYDLGFSSATARAGRELGFYTHNGDRRWAPPEKETIARTTPADFQGFYAPLLAAGPVEAVIVGDVSLETAVKAMRSTIAALPRRPSAPKPKGVDTVRPPPPAAAPAQYVHQGDAAQAYATIGWTTFGGIDRIRERRALALAANMFQVRLFDELREAEGASYSPDATGTASETFPNWGAFFASAEVRPENTETFFRIARTIVADLAAKPARADEFARAQNPVISGVERQMKTNGYWLSVMGGWIDQPELIEQTRSQLADYRSLTPQDVQSAVKAHVADESDWSFVVLPAKKAGGGN